MRRLGCLAIVVSAVCLLAETAAAQEFRFREDGSRSIPVSIGEGSTLSWPETPGQWDTALLSVQVNVDPSAATPYVEIIAGGKSDRQYFLAGSSGERWLNLSFLRGTLKPALGVTLRGEGASVPAGPATLRLFDSNPDLTKSILVLAPHPDDAEIAAFGIYAHRRSTVVTVTAGNAGAPTYDSVFDDPGEQYLFKGRIRLIDSITIPWQGGIPPERAFNMGYFDGRLAEMHDKRDEVIPELYRPNSDINVYRKDNIGSLLPKQSRMSRWGHLVDDTLAILKKVNPSVIVAPHPQLDTHRDHQFTTVALVAALARWKKDVTLLLYTNHADTNRYPYGPAGTLMSLPPPPAGDAQIDRVYSHPVSPSLQRIKLFALESMHDLRYTPTRQYQLAKGDDRTMAPEKPGPEPDITYLRRGPRSNEMFYVYDQDSVKPMIEAFLKRRAQPAGVSK